MVVAPTAWKEILYVYFCQTKKIFLVVLIFAATSTVHCHHGGNHDAHYKFGYGVYDPHTLDQKQHLEERHGKHVIGVYSVKEPDGSHRTVKYRVGPHTGFEAFLEEVGGPHRHGGNKKTINDIGVFRWDDKEGDGGKYGNSYKN
ncbi:hypothetical protein NQ318_012389 [Aromia moschata]|uniref:Uncharacterized protein n=1 Tax=Aromia moschata TaxID=1265417 RepID=A0AAV8Y358_9CUCU|nr:hypothetical protein NQ318_012389 [Aromia moschata]